MFKNMLKEFLVKFREIVENTTPAGVDPFNGDTSEKLNEEMRTTFHQTVAQGPFVHKQAQPNMQPMIAVLCASVKALGQKNWSKSVRLMKCSHSTVNNALNLDTGNGVHVVEWQVDSTFGVHPDFKSHVSRTVTFKGGKGLAINVPAKQKLNTESFTVAEPVGVDCALPLALWVPPFLKEQGHKGKGKHH